MAAEQTERQDGPCPRLANVNKIVRPRGRDWLDLSSPHSSNWTKRCQRYRALLWLHVRKLESVQLDWNLTVVWIEEPCTTFLSCDFGKWYAHPQSQVDGKGAEW